MRLAGTRQPRFLARSAALPGLLVLLGFGLRVMGLGTYDFWYDEIGQILAARSQGLAEVVSAAAKHYGAAPLDYLLTWFGTRLAGESEFALRFLPLMWSTVAVALAYALANAVFPRAGKWAALFVAISPLAIRYAQEVRFYSLGLMLGTACVTIAAFVGRGWVKASIAAWLSLMLVAAATLYTHVYSALLLLAGAAIIAALSPPRRKLRLTLWYSGAAAVALCAFSPWLFGALNARPHPLGTSNLGGEHLLVVLGGLEVVGAGGRVIADWPASLYPLAIAALYILAIAALLADRRARRITGGLVLAIASSASLVVAGTLAAHYFFSARQFLFLLPLRALLFGMLLAMMEERARAPVALKRAGVAAFAALLLASAASLVGRGYNRVEATNASQAARAVANRIGTAGPNVWFVPRWLSLSVDYYLAQQGSPPAEWQRLEGDAVGAAAAQRLREAPAGSVVVVAQTHSGIVGQLEEAGFKMAWPGDASLQPFEFMIFVK